MLPPGHRLLLLGCALWALASPARADIVSMTLVDDGEKLAPTRSVPAPQGLQLFAMRNEVIAFQVLVRSDTQGAENLQLRIQGLDGAQIELFREDMIPIRERSHELVWKPKSAAEPANMLGEIPDRLVAIDGQGLSVAADGQQVYWIDVWLPPDLPAGDLHGVIEIAGEPTGAAACASCTQAVTIELLDRTMPDAVRARSMLWFSGGDRKDDLVNARYFSDPRAVAEEDKRELRRQHYQLAHQHRITLFWGQEQEPDDELRALLSGAAFSADAGYTGPGAGLGQDLLVLEAYGGELSSEEARAWLAFAAAYSTLRSVFVYVMDEPGASDRDELNRRVQASKPMPAFVTSTYQPEIEADIFAAPAWQYSAAQAEEAQAAGKSLWIYNGARPFSGSFAIDDVAVAPRVNPWIQYKFGIERWFYWESTYYDDFQGKRGAVDVMANGINFTNRHGDRVNGDGLLIYPGRDMLFPASDAGVSEPLASIRLKNWRRGVQDVEYLVMARAAGFDEEVTALLETLLPRVLHQTRDGRAVSWPEDGQRWLLARRYLFELLRDGRSDIEVAGLARAPAASSGGSARSRSSVWIAALGLCLVGLALAAGLAWRRRGAARDRNVSDRR